MTPPPTVPTATCYRHPGKATVLRCSSCGRSICSECTTMGAVGQLCPECVRTRGRQGTVRPSIRSRPPVTTAIVAVTVGLFLLQVASPRVGDTLYELFAQANFLVADGEWWRIVTPVLVHANIPHIFFNMWALWQLGPRIEQSAGGAAYFLAYLACAAWGGAVAYRLAEASMVAVGASGAVFGLFGMWLVAAFHRRETRFGRALLSQLGFLLLVNALLPFILPGIAWQAHLGGLLAGMAMAESWRRVQSREGRTAVAGAFLVAAVASVLV